MSLSLKAQDFSVGYNNQPLFRPVSFEIQSSQTLFIIGSNGRGKSTLGKALIGLEKPLTGVIHMTEEVSIGYMPQGKLQVPHLPLTVQGFLKLFHKIDSFSQLILTRLDIHPLEHLQVNHLSYGQWQRVNLAQALLHKPRLLLVDEPAAGLDIKWQERIYNILSEYAQTFDALCLCISHDTLALNTNADWVLCLDHSSFKANVDKNNNPKKTAFTLMTHQDNEL